MKKYVALICLLFSACFFLIHPDSLIAQSGPFTVKVRVLTRDLTPLENAKVVLASNDRFLDIDIQTTDGSGIAKLTAKYGGEYSLDIFRDTYVSVHTSYHINKYGEETEFSLVYDLEKKMEADEKISTSFLITVKGKDETGNIKPVMGARIHTLIGNYTTDGSGFANISHTLSKGYDFPYYVEADGYKPANGVLIIDEGKSMYWTNRKPDNIEIILDPIGEEDYGKLKAGTFTLNVLVLSSENDSPVADALVDLKMRQLYEGKSEFSSVRTDSKGIAKFDGVLTTLIQNELYVSGTHKDFDEKWSDLTKDFFRDVTEKEFTFTLYLNPKTIGTKKFALESVDYGNKLEPHQGDYVDLKTWRRVYLFEGPDNNTTVEFTNLSESFPKGIDPGDNIYLKAVKKVNGRMPMDQVKAKAVWEGPLHYASDFYDISESGTTIQVPPEIYYDVIKLVIHVRDNIYDRLGWIIATYKKQK